MSDTLQIADQSVLLCKLMCYENVYNKEVLRHDEYKNNWNNWQNKVQFPFFPFFFSLGMHTNQILEIWFIIR